MIGEFIASGAAGAIIVAIINFLIKKRKEDRTDFNDIIRLLKEELKEEREMNRENARKQEICQNKIQELLRRINELEIRLMLFESANMTNPFPCWLKDSSLSMLELNTAYEKTFLVPRGLTKFDYIGKKDYEVWDEETARSFIANDKAVMQPGKYFFGIEMVEGTPWVIIKYPRFSGETLIGIAGVALPLKEFKTNLSSQQRIEISDFLR